MLTVCAAASTGGKISGTALLLREAFVIEGDKEWSATTGEWVRPDPVPPYLNANGTKGDWQSALEPVKFVVVECGQRVTSLDGLPGLPPGYPPNWHALWREAPNAEH